MHSNGLDHTIGLIIEMETFEKPLEKPSVLPEKDFTFKFRYHVGVEGVQAISHD